ncbi:MAG: polymorphic toxin-type HINT domain-containing protein [Isosphaeraceae bacterium]
MSVLLASVVAAGVAGSAPPETGAVRSEYEAEAAKAGADPRAHLKLALWCEAHGLNAERLRHLAGAVLRDPGNAAARGLMGLVSYGGQWRPADAVSDRVRADEALSAKLAAYNARRAHTPDTADAQWKLALWCEENGLTAEAQAHLTAVVRLDPAREAAWKRLGCRKVGGRWVTDAQLAAEKAEADARKKADRAWRPQLTKWRTMLADRNPSKRAEAEKALSDLTDPRAVPAVFDLFADGPEALQEKAVEVLGRIDGTEASRALAVLALNAASAEVRRKAAETLRHRDLRDVVGWLIAQFRKPMKYEVRPVGGPGSPGALFVEGERFNVQRLYSPPPMPNIPIFPGEEIEFDAEGLPVVSRFLGPSAASSSQIRNLVRVSYNQYVGLAPVNPALGRVIAEARRNTPNSDIRNPNQAVVINETTTTSTPLETTVRIPIGQIMRQYQTSALVAGQQLAADVAAVEAHNAAVSAVNGRVGQVLRGLTGHDEGDEAQPWAAWWTDRQGYVYKITEEPFKPTIVEDVPLAYVPQGVPVVRQTYQSGPPVTSTSTVAQNAHSCFRAGTSVRTLTGPKPIESLRVGDRVLVEDTSTGVLTYQPILSVYHNPPATLHAVDLGDETVWATGIHRFWKVGKGWVMARDLKPGDVLRTLGGTARVKSVTEGGAEPVFNLEVAAGQSFFVGSSGALVHDNSLVRPVAEPFDALAADVR